MSELAKFSAIDHPATISMEESCMKVLSLVSKYIDKD